MTKYEPLRQFLESQKTEIISMSFNEIEGIIGEKLPPSAYKYRAWWSNNPGNSVMTSAWLGAGYVSEQVDMGSAKLVFRRKQDHTPSDHSIGQENRNPFVTLTIQLPAEIHQSLLLRARQYGHSPREEVMEILRHAVQPEPEDRLAISRRLRAQTRSGREIDPVALIREDRDRL